MLSISGIAEAFGIIILAVVALIPRFHCPGGGLNRLGLILFTVGAVVLLVSMGFGQYINAQLKDRIAELTDALFLPKLEWAMTAPASLEPSVPPPASDGIRILGPEDRSVVEPRHLIRGKISIPANQVWVIVHPTETGAYFVQPAIAVKRTGGWSVMAYFGRPGSIDAGKTFDVLAVVDPEMDLREGQILEAWPNARLASSTIVVTRR